MNIIKIRDLSEDTMNQIDSIVKAQDREHHLPLYFDFTDERCVYYLGYDNEKLLSVLALFEIDINMYEAIAFTDIDNRKKGYFSSIFNCLLSDLNAGAQVSFLCEKGYAPAVAVSEKLDLIYDCTETMMELDLSTYVAKKTPGFDILKENDNIFYIYHKGEEIGSFCFYTFSFDKKDVYFHSFNIYVEYRGKGLGRLSMKAIISYLKGIGKAKIHLQLLLENTPAYKIYKELGFKINSEISYYKIVKSKL